MSQMTITEGAMTPAINFKRCPIEVISSILGKKWTLLILRDIGLLKIGRFNRILRSLPGLTPRVLTLRLQELEGDGLIEAVVLKDRPRIVEWVLTEKGGDTMPVLMSVIAFGAKWYADEVFEDRHPRTLDELYPPRVPEGCDQGFSEGREGSRGVLNP